MGEIKNPQPVKLIVGFIYKDRHSFEKARALLIRKFGLIDFESNPICFCHTDYYEKEFGRGLTRTFISFKRLISPQAIAAIKILTNKIEKKFSLRPVRQINIDPGYIDLAKLVLASTKDYYHRIYLSKGIFAEITLSFRDKTFKFQEWTYPDYRTPEYIEIFNHIRHIYEGQIN
jgi:hypothetical protein